MQIPKPKKYRNREYLAWIRTKPCLISGKAAVPCHVRRKYWGAGTGTKSHDYCTIPLAPEYNTYEYEREYGTDRQIAELLMEYIEFKRTK